MSEEDEENENEVDDSDRGLKPDEVVETGEDSAQDSDRDRHRALAKVSDSLLGVSTSILRFKGDGWKLSKR